MTGEIACTCVGCGAAFSARPVGGHRLACGDSTTGVSVDAALGGAKPHLMVTDPPYGVDYDADWRNRAIMVKGEQRGEHGSRAVGKVSNDGQADWRLAWALFPGGVAYVWHGGLHGAEVAESLAAAKFKLRAQIVWVKTRPVISRGDYHWQHEPLFHVVKEGEDDHWRFIAEHEISDYAVRVGSTGHWEGGRKQSTVWMIEHIKSETGHSTQKPVECMKRPILNNSDVGEAVYDPFVGSGTTIIAAEMTGRSCIAIELTPGYVDVGVLRWQAFTGKAAVLEATGRTYADTEALRAAPVKSAGVKSEGRAVRTSSEGRSGRAMSPAADDTAAVAAAAPATSATMSASLLTDPSPAVAGGAVRVRSSRVKVAA